ncbi:MAG: redoxin domain-containing protein [Phycisphaerae bacterium]|nr:redoxin domain-containing protein [Phycisphaerae bacterium]
MSHKIALYALLTAILINQTAWTQARPGAAPGLRSDRRTETLRDRAASPGEARVNAQRQIAELNTQIMRLKAEQKALITELKDLQDLATQEKAEKTLEKVTQLIKAKESDYDSRINALQQRVQRMATAMNTMAKRNQAENRVNTQAPSFTAKSFTGQDINFSDYKGKIVVLEWLNPECQYTKFAYQKNKLPALAKQYSYQKDVVWLGVCSTPPTNPTAILNFVTQSSIEHPVINDASGQIARLYYAKATPQIIIVDKDGKIAYTGAFDNSLPKPKDGKVIGYAANALTELLEGKPVTLPVTPPIGTPIKTDRIR